MKIGDIVIYKENVKQARQLDILNDIGVIIKKNLSIYHNDIQSISVYWLNKEKTHVTWEHWLKHLEENK